MRIFQLGGYAVALGLMAAGTQSTAQDASPTAADAEAIVLPNWMAGCWVSESVGDARTEECWTAPRGSMLLGSGHSYEGPRTRSFEHMRIESVDGTLVFVAQPGGSPPTRFTLQATRVGTDLRDGLLFVNVANDYPQRIQYWREGAELIAEISQIDGSNAMRWRFRRAGGG